MLVGIAESAATSVVFAASYPERVDRLVLFTPYVRRVSDEDDRARMRERIRVERALGRPCVPRGNGAHAEPTVGGQRGDLARFVEHHLLPASPATIVEFRRMQLDLDIGDVLSAVRVPTLVLVSSARPSGGPRSATGRGASSSRSSEAVSAASSSAIGVRRSTRPETGSSPDSTGLPARSPARAQLPPPPPSWASPCARGSTRASASSWTGSPRGSRFTSEHASRRSQHRERFSSRAPSEISSRAPASRSTNVASRS